MKPKEKSEQLLGKVRSKAKMYEYGTSEEHHEELQQDPAKLFIISIGLLGHLAASINREEKFSTSKSDLKTNLLFSARFFDSYFQSKLNESLDPYVIILGSASYYLCDLPGSATVLAKKMSSDLHDFGIDGLEKLLHQLLQDNTTIISNVTDSSISVLSSNIAKSYNRFFQSGEDENQLLELANSLRKIVYEFGTPREFLFVDVIAAVLRKKIENSTWIALPKYSGLSREKWLNALQKETFIKELWPAQHLLGKRDVLKGKSAVMQMPTSAGKTKATELIIRSAFLAERTKLVVLIAPFRALCHEIQNDLCDAFQGENVMVDIMSDVLQPDFSIDDILKQNKILVVTPEKLLYVLRQSPEIADNIGVLIFDEGHQFDNDIRGITYELLLTSLLSMIPEGIQKVLISAVISNAESISEWLYGEQNIVKETEEISLNPTFRSIGFSSWRDQFKGIEYVDDKNIEKNEFSVPRVIEQFTLAKKGKERNDRFFPEKDGKSVALYLGLKLMREGGVAIFCGRKDTAANICKLAVDIIERGISLDLPIKFSFQEEVCRLTYLHHMNLGNNSYSTKSAAYGIFHHHGDTPHGIRMAVEYAMRKDDIRFVVCTSTLAQGVNLPIKYLIVAGISQGKKTMKVRDFQNLIGRAGRAGLHTEGSILFADPNVYDGQKDQSRKWRWEKVKDLLAVKNREPCISNLLSIFNPFISDNGDYEIVTEPLDFINTYINNPEEISNLAIEIIRLHGYKGFSQDGVERQVAWRINLISAVESFLLSHWDEAEVRFTHKEVINLAEKTLAFYLADEQKKDYIRKLFLLLAKNISEKIEEPEKRKIYGKTLYGIQKAIAIEEWVHENTIQLLSIAGEAEAINLVWPLFVEHVNKGVFTKFDPLEFRKELIHKWIMGESYYALLNTINGNDVKKISGKRREKFTIDDIVNVCEGAFGYEGAMLLGAVCGFVEALSPVATADTVRVLQRLQKRIKYGLPTATTVALYELGFSDRVIAQDIAASMQLMATSSKTELEGMLKNRKDEALALMEKYPSYFQERMRKLVE